LVSEPLGHFGGGRTLAGMGVAMPACCVICAALSAACHGEIGFQIKLFVRPAIDRWNRADHGSGVEHVVVEGKVVGRDDRSVEVTLAFPGLGAKIRRDSEQRLGIDFSGPMVFECGLQFTPGPDAGGRRGSRR
jgi:hypothetical protein